MFGRSKKQSQDETAGSQITTPIFTMPKEYRHGASPMRVAPSAPTIVAAPAPRPAPQKPIPPKVTPSTAKKFVWRNVVVIGGIILILALAIGGYFLLQTTKPKTQPRERPAAETATPLPTPPIPEPQVETPPPSKEEEPASPFPTTSTPGRDTDSDGLTDVEENIIYRTNPRMPDTDKDGFLDGNEVFHGYHPDGLAPNTLFTSNLVQKFDAASFSIFYPSGWALQQRGEADDVLILATTGESMSVAVLPKVASQTLAEWHASQPAGATVEPQRTKKGLEALVTQDAMTAYMDAVDGVLVFSLHTGVKGTVEYLQTFQMMLNSLTVF